MVIAGNLISVREPVGHSCLVILWDLGIWSFNIDREVDHADIRGTHWSQSGAVVPAALSETEGRHPPSIGGNDRPYQARSLEAGTAAKGSAAAGRADDRQHQRAS